MQTSRTIFNCAMLCIFSLLLSSCATFTSDGQLSSNQESFLLAKNKVQNRSEGNASYESRLPQTLHTGQKTILIDPRVHAWGAYNANGDLIRAGLVTAGAKWCPDIKRACKTRAGSFHIQSLGSVNCKSSIYPLPRGGAPMPYCMFFNGNQGLHGTYGNGVIEGNISHGCVRMRVADAEWVRFNFANIGTKVIVRPY